MQTRAIRRAIACGTLAAATWGLAPTVDAARVAILSNSYAEETAIDFSAKVPGHTFTAFNVNSSVPTLAALTANFDVLLVFEDSTFPNATAVGNVAAAFANSGRTVVLGTFYEQDRSDGAVAYTPHGWGALELIDPNTSDGTGTPYTPHALDPASIVSPHPLTANVTTLTAARFAGGNEAKPGTTVVANWMQKNARGHADPAIAYRVTGPACVIHIATAPDYATVGTAGTDFGGDFYAVWENAFDFGAANCVVGPDELPDAVAIPALGSGVLATVALALAAFGGLALMRRRS